MAVDLEEVTRFFEEAWELPLVVGWDWVRRDSRTFTTKIGERTVTLTRYGKKSKHYLLNIDSYTTHHMPYGFDEICAQGVIKVLFYIEDHKNLKPEEIIRALKKREGPNLDF